MDPDRFAADAPVETDLSGVRGAWHCAVDDRRKADTLSGLRDRSVEK